MEEIKSWLEEEERNLSSQGTFDKLPTPVFEDGKITAVEVDISKPFEKWTDMETKKTKAIIPCMSVIDGKLQRANWWLNVKNPVYKEVIHKAREAQGTILSLKIFQSGKGEKTTYSLVKE